MESVELMWKDSPEDELICVAVLRIFIIITKRYVRCWMSMMNKLSPSSI